jgi:predicted secreted protein
MVKKLIFTSLVPLALFSYELNFSKKFSKEISPDILSARISVSIQNKDERFINDNLESINEFIKESQNIKYKNGNFNLTPRYSYQNNKKIFSEYFGNLSYIITSKDPIFMNEFINDLVELKDKIAVDSLKLNINNTSWKISQSKYDSSLDSLRLEAINWINSYSTQLSHSCKVKKIIINTSGNNFQYNSVNTMAVRDMAKISPAKSLKSLSINPNYTLECK